MSARGLALVAVAAAAAAGAVGCGDSPDPVAEAARADPSPRVAGGGEIHPAGLIEEWTARFGTRVDVQPLGTERGIQRLRDGKLAFAVSDRPLTAAEADALDAPLLDVPAAVTRVAVIHNLGSDAARPRLTGRLVARILLGRIQRWDDDAIARRAESPRALSDAPIVICHRSDQAPETLVLSTWLTRSSEQWRRGPGVGREVRWPTGTGASGDEGVATCVRQNPGSIGYVDGGYAEREELAVVRLRNGDGEYVVPSARAAAANVAGERGGYPLTGVVRVLVARDACRAGLGVRAARVLARWLDGVLGPGQAVAQRLDHVALPAEARRRAQRELRRMRCDGRPLAAGAN